MPAPENSNSEPERGWQLAKKLGVKHPKDLPFDQGNMFGCNGCDDIRAQLNVEGYCKACAEKQGAYEFPNAAPSFDEAMHAFEAHCGACATCKPVRESGSPDAHKLCAEGQRLLYADIDEEKANAGGFPLSHFKRPETKERADSQGIEDVEDDDLTTAGLRAKLEALEEGHGDEALITAIKGKLGIQNAVMPACLCGHFTADHDGDEGPCQACACPGYRAGDEAENTATGRNAAGGVWDKYEQSERAELLKQAALVDNGHSARAWTALDDGYRAQLTRTLGFQNASKVLHKDSDGEEVREFDTREEADAWCAELRAAGRYFQMGYPDAHDKKYTVKAWAPEKENATVLTPETDPGGPAPMNNSKLPDGWMLVRGSEIKDADGQRPDWADKAFYVLDSRTDAAGEGGSEAEAIADAKAHALPGQAWPGEKKNDVGDRVRGANERDAKQAYGKCACGQTKRDQEDPRYHTPNSDRCKSIQGGLVEGPRENSKPKYEIWQEPDTSGNHIGGGDPPPFEVRDENDQTVFEAKTEAEARAWATAHGELKNADYYTGPCKTPGCGHAMDDHEADSIAPCSKCACKNYTAPHENASPKSKHKAERDLQWGKLEDLTRRLHAIEGQDGAGSHNDDPAVRAILTDMDIAQKAHDAAHAQYITAHEAENSDTAEYKDGERHAPIQDPKDQRAKDKPGDLDAAAKLAGKDWKPWSARENANESCPESKQGNPCRYENGACVYCGRKGSYQGGAAENAAWGSADCPGCEHAFMDHGSCHQEGGCKKCSCIYNRMNMGGVRKPEAQNGWTTNEKMVMREGVTCPKCGDRGRLYVSEKTGLCDACMKEAYDKEHANAACVCCQCGKQFDGPKPADVDGRPGGAVCPECAEKKNAASVEDLAHVLEGKCAQCSSAYDKQSMDPAAYCPIGAKAFEKKNAVDLGEYKGYKMVQTGPSEIKATRDGHTITVHGASNADIEVLKREIDAAAADWENANTRPAPHAIPFERDASAQDLGSNLYGSARSSEVKRHP